MTRQIPPDILASARLTADAWGIAYIGITRSVPDWGAGGRWYVTRTADAGHYSGMPLVRVATVNEDGTVTPCQ